MSFKFEELRNDELARTASGFMGAPYASSAQGAKAAILGYPLIAERIQTASAQGRDHKQSATSRDLFAHSSPRSPTTMFARRSG